MILGFKSLVFLKKVLRKSSGYLFLVFYSIVFTRAFLIPLHLLDSFLFFLFTIRASRNRFLAQGRPFYQSKTVSSSCLWYLDFYTCLKNLSNGNVKGLLFSHSGKIERYSRVCRLTQACVFLAAIKSKLSSDVLTYSYVCFRDTCVNIFECSRI